MSEARERDAVLRALLTSGTAISPVRAVTVVELGAHRGEEFPWLGFGVRLARYVMVEPDTDNFQLLVDQYAKSSLVDLVVGAVGPFDGHATFYGSYSVQDGVRGSGSIRRPVEHLKHFPNIKFPECRRFSVPCYTLDTLYQRSNLQNVDLLWVDIQGAERDMIAGGAAALLRTRYLFMEAEPEVRMYEGQLLKAELLALLPDWELIEDFDYNVLLKNKLFRS